MNAGGVVRRSTNVCTMRCEDGRQCGDSGCTPLTNRGRCLSCMRTNGRNADCTVCPQVVSVWQNYPLLK